MGLDGEQIDNWDRGVEVGNPQGPWSQTASGQRFYPLNPQASAVNLDDIAHHLSFVNRYGGATIYPYSVAQHTLLCVALARSLFPGNASLRRWAMLHDAPEYVLGDVVRPVKTLLSQYDVLEARLMDVIADRFGLVPLTPHGEGDLRYIDQLACVIEMHTLLPNREVWGGLPTYVGGFDYYVREINWRIAKHELRVALKQEFDE